MKGLKILLGAIYVGLILLLLLPCKCCREKAAEPEADDEGVELPPVTERFAADVVMCIDATGSMGSIIETVKSNALNFYPDLKRAARRLGKDITGMRIRVIAFRDYDHTQPLTSSDFFTMPDEENGFRSYVSGIWPDGGGSDVGELSLDAIREAVEGSGWSAAPRTKRVILLWTDDMAKTLSTSDAFDSTVRKWNSFGPAKKMILFTSEDVISTPTAYVIPWSHIESKFVDAVRYTNSGSGLSDLDYEEILRNISEDI